MTSATGIPTRVVSVRLPVALVEQYEETAFLNHRSLSKEVQHALVESMDAYRRSPEFTAAVRRSQDRNRAILRGAARGATTRSGATRKPAKKSMGR